jgi:hypothetical protein
MQLGEILRKKIENEIEMVKGIKIRFLITFLLAAFVPFVCAQATQTFDSYCTNITCNDTGTSVTCTCSEVRYDDGNYAGPTDAGPGAGINCDGGYCIITINYFNSMPQNSIIVGSQIVANWYVKGLGPNAPCKLEIYRNSTGTWHDITTSCPTTEATYYYNISSVISNQSDFEKIILRFNYTDLGQAGAQKILIDQAYVSADYLYATNLTAWDETDTVPKNPGDSIMFWANFTNATNSVPLDGANCILNLAIPGGFSTSMNYDPSGFYYYNWTSDPSLSPGTYKWNVTCIQDYYEPKTHLDSFGIGTPYVITDSASYISCNTIYYKISIFDVNDQPTDTALTNTILDAVNATVMTENVNTGNGGTGIYLGVFPIPGGYQPGNWIIKAVSGSVKGQKTIDVS